MAAALVAMATACSSGDDKNAAPKPASAYATEMAQLKYDFERATEAGDNGEKAKLMPRINELKAEIESRTAADKDFAAAYDQAYIVAYDSIITSHP